MATAALHKQFESVLGGHLDWQSRPAPERVRTGVSEIDAATGGLPRGSLTEIFGPPSSGRTSLMFSVLAEATAREEVCALVDTEDALDPSSAAAAGVHLHRLLWIRCGHNAEHALKAADLLIQGGGFGVVVMDLGETAPETARRISLTSWFRLRRAVEHTPTVLLAVALQSNAKTCASLVLDCRRERSSWSGASGPSRLLRSIGVRVASRQRSKQCLPVFTAKAI
jgi:recombination protein RecA